MDTKELVEFIMFVGIPASGKTTEAEKYRRKGYAIYSSDVIRAEIEEKLATGQMVMPTNTDLNSLVFDTIKSVNIIVVRAYRNAIESRQLVGKYTAFKSCMYGNNLGALSVFALVNLAHNVA